MQSAKDLETVAVDLYNNYDFSNAERLCTIILQMYEKIDSEKDIKRMKQILQKLSLVEEYFNATFGLIKKQIEKQNEKEEVKNK